MGLSYERLADELAAAPQTERLLGEFVESRLADDGAEFFEIRTGAGYQLLSTSSLGVADPTPSAVNDLIRYGLLRIGRHDSRGGRVLEVDGQALVFRRWLLERRGNAVAQVEDEVRRFMDSPAFAASHGSAARHLDRAFELLWTGAIDDATVSELGGHLRTALIECAATSIGLPQPDEDLQSVLDRLRSKSTRRGDLAVVGLADFAAAVMREDQRLTHVRDERVRDREPVDWMELRRAAFLTAVCCHELAFL